MFKDKEYYDQQFTNLQYSQKKLKSIRFYDCTFTKCDISESIFENCKFSNCIFECCDLNLIKVFNSEFSHVSFINSKLVGINWTEADWPKILNQSLLRFEECAMSHSTFIGLTLPKCTIRKCIAKNVDFREADLTEADMRSTDFSESLFNETNLMGADFSHATNYAIDPVHNRIKKATFMLPEATSILYCMDVNLVDDY